jgi:hypothetical protein
MQICLRLRWKCESDTEINLRKGVCEEGRDINGSSSRLCPMADIPIEPSGFTVRGFVIFDGINSCKEKPAR